MTTEATPSAAEALELFKSAPAEALLPPAIVAAVMGVPIASLDKARCVGDAEFPAYVKLGARVRYKAGTVRAHLAKLEEKVMA